MEIIIMIKNLFLDLKKSEILLYALVGISCFAFWLIGFCFVKGDLNVMTWDEGTRLGLLITSVISSFLITAMMIDSRRAK